MRAKMPFFADVDPAGCFWEMPLSVAGRDRAVDLVLILAGRLDRRNVPLLRVQILDWVRSGRLHCLDLARIEAIDSAGVAVLVEFCRLARRNGTELELRAVSAAVHRILRLFRLESLVEPTGRPELCLLPGLDSRELREI